MAHDTLPTFRSLSDFAMPSHQVVLVLAQARTLKRAALAGRTQPLLKGKKLGLLCDSDLGPEARLFRRAATELGAHVAHVRPVLSETSPAHDVSHTARLLGRLYDALECQGLAPGLVQRIAEDAGVPVYDAIAGAAHPTARLVDMLDDDDASPEDKRRFVLQAVLLNAVA